MKTKELIKMLKKYKDKEVLFVDGEDLYRPVAGIALYNDKLIILGKNIKRNK